ncbi:MAG: DegV family protein, partial [Ruminococcus sp.]|nr:DegV family protein [Ruminococcus sp.]
MAKIKFMTDSASDITAEYEKEYDIMVVPFKVAMGDKSYVSRVDFDNEKFYEMIDSFDGIPATSQITVFEYKEIFENLFNEGYT